MACWEAGDGKDVATSLAEGALVERGALRIMAKSTGREEPGRHSASGKSRFPSLLSFDPASGTRELPGAQEVRGNLRNIPLELRSRLR